MITTDLCNMLLLSWKRARREVLAFAFLETWQNWEMRYYLDDNMKLKESGRESNHILFKHGHFLLN